MAASSSSSSVVPTTRRNGEWTYDVCISFHDEARSFINHLYAKLDQNKIHVFKVEQTLDERKAFLEEHLKAINKSRFAVVVFSKKYRDYNWSLEELSNIMECHKQIGQQVIPVYYHVHPNQIRVHKKDHPGYEEGERDFREWWDGIKKWRDALSAATDLQGLHISSHNSSASASTEKIVQHILADKQPRGDIEPRIDASRRRRGWTYDVYISFRGEDAPKNFVDHLYGALVEKGIHVFKEDMIRIGQPISEERTKAVKESMFAVVVFSENYRKTWCLEELSNIMECHKQIGQQVIPVYYHVDPSDISEQKGDLQETFDRYDYKFERDKVKKWRDALRIAATLPGYPISPHNTSDSATITKIVEEIVEEISADVKIRERKIGKISFFYDQIIGEGSNGTIVLEGYHGTRPAAVKRIVKEHYDDVTSNEIDNLIKSDGHPNIVRYYDVERDREFVYIALERCICSLHELISSPTKATVKSLQLTLKVNGRPSPELLNLLRDTVAGLDHLHKINYIHRDVKPQNVLISKDHSSIIAKVSDMGISKCLPSNNMSSLTSATGSGSSGWQAPEILRKEPQTKAVDLFSYGCLLFFCITGGRHPFGDDIHERDTNIEYDNPKNLSLVEHIPEALDLVSNLIRPDPESRQTAAEAYHHPLFWDPDLRLDFLRDGSDYIEAEYKKNNNSELQQKIETIGTVAYAENTWDVKLDSTLLKNIATVIPKMTKYDSVRDLIRLIRNMFNHYKAQSADVQSALVNVPTGVDEYFSSRFPKLLMEVYKVLKPYGNQEPTLKKYYKNRGLAASVNKVVGEVSAHTAPSGVSSGSDETDDGLHPNVEQTTKGDSSGGDLTGKDDYLYSSVVQPTKVYQHPRLSSGESLDDFNPIPMASSSSLVQTRKRVWKYDVYLSFRGDEDTRNNFVGPLYAALTMKGIRVFQEDKIGVGQLVSEELPKAIRESRVAVVVFSKNYANSSWCLEELSMIMECQNQMMGPHVIPVFYGVNPSNVQYQNGDFAAAFLLHEDRFKGEMDKVNKWRNALTAAANLPGQHNLPNNRGQAASINKVVGEVSARTTPSGVSSGGDLTSTAPETDDESHFNVAQTTTGEWTYDVFLSFSQKDTGNNFTDHLNDALLREGKRVFKEFKENEMQPISQDVVKAIKESRFAVVVFSKNYATCSLCLEELSTIMESHAQNGGPKRVLPVYYHVNRSVISRQSVTLQRDKNALTAATNSTLSVIFDIRPDNRGESAFVKDIVREILADFEIRERIFGDLFFGKKELGRGRNGTIVLEGKYKTNNSRNTEPVAVKRIVNEYHSSKEIENLIKSGDHDNIVKYYGVVYGKDFVYIALEHCICNLHEFILTQTNPNTHRLQQLKSEFPSFQLQMPNKHPTPELLKVMRGIVAGLDRLHERRIVHRDLKPQNVLISKDLRAKISDLGISEVLPPNMSSFTSATGYGSSGWQAPETLCKEAETKAVDLFSYGCLLFFCITGGRHPFGDDIHERDTNIKNHNPNNLCKPIHLSLLDDIPEAFDLVENLIQRNPKSRPTAAEAYHHPLFWDSQRRLEFFRDGSNYIEAENQKNNNSELQQKIQTIGTVAYAENTWDVPFGETLLKSIHLWNPEKYYRSNSVRDLIRLIRNMFNYYTKQSLYIQSSFNNTPTGVDEYFRRGFPKLLMEVYKVLKPYHNQPALKTYYETTLVTHT